MEEDNNNDNPSIISSRVPKVALRWLLLHATTSNVELARLSNVCRSWRDVVLSVILEQATYKTLPHSVPLLLLPSMASQLIRVNNGAGSDEKTTTTTSTTTTTENGETFCAAWFAPEGVQLLDLDQEQRSSENESSASSGEDIAARPSQQRLHRHCRHSSSQSTVGVAANTNSQKGSHAKSPHALMTMNLQRRPPKLEQIPQQQSWTRGFGAKAKSVVSFQDQGIMVTHEWQGYRHAMQVLFPFGYADCFVQHVLQQAQVQDQILRRRRIQSRQKPQPKQQRQEQSDSEDKDNENESIVQDLSESVHEVNLNTQSHHLSESLEDQDSYHPNPNQHQIVNDNTVTTAQTTIAVRGATIARPEGYCLCWEHASSQQQVEWSRKANGNNNNNEMVKTIKFQERQRKLRQWKEWRRQLQLTVLPKVLVRSPPTSNAVVQFLNSDEKHAVRFMTPPFACGPIGEPVTILVVGIATEDGCFCSGLHHRFELGHLYPNSPVMELSELSPICMATDPWESPADIGTSSSQQQNATAGCGNGVTPSSPASSSSSSSPPPRKTPLEQHLSDDDSEDDSDDYEDDSSSDLAGSPSRNPTKKRGWLDNCTCIFQDNSDPMGFGAATNENDNQKNAGENNNISEGSQTMRLDDDDDEDNDDGKDQETDAERILRGSRIPGMWHCYTAVFDGKNYSTLRVDGVEEALTCDSQDNPNSIGAESASIRNSDKDSFHSKRKNESSPRNHRSRRGPRAMLDGLTIGSDHCFDMTLCFGQGSGGEGEGAIAEIAVFAGRLDTQDLKVLEKQLMLKHGIPTPDMPHEALVQEDEWTRKASALYCQIPSEVAASHLRHSDGSPLAFDETTIPLRIMTKHRSVAWHQTNAVTGEELRIKRIGSRSAGSSSDW